MWRTTRLIRMRVVTRTAMSCNSDPPLPAVWRTAERPANVEREDKGYRTVSLPSLRKRCRIPRSVVAVGRK